jgi:peptide/nickel transport system substrate-binding protein
MRLRPPRILRGRGRCAFTTVLLGLALLSACYSDDSLPADAAGDALSTVTVYYGGQANEEALSPSWDMPARFLVFLPLVRNDEHGEPEGMLLSRWEHTPDYRTWEYHLRPNLRWHDGEPVTAHDIRFTIDLLNHPDVLGKSPGRYSEFLIQDDTTFTVTWQKGPPRGGGPKPLHDYMVFFPEHLLEKLDPAEFWSWEFWKRPIGNGPYRFVRHVEKTMVELEANPDFYSGKPRIDRVRLKFGGNPIVELLAGNVDILAWPVSPRAAFKIKDDPRFVAYHAPEGLGVALYWNHRHPFFSDSRVRSALSMAVNRKEIASANDFPDMELYDVLYSPRQYVSGNVIPPLPHDPEASRRLLEETGWQDLDGDGILERDGVPFRFKALVSPGWGDRAAIPVQAHLRRVGVDMQIETMEFSVVKRRLRSGDFEAMIHRQRGDILVHGSPTGYENRQVLDLIQAITVEMDPAVQDSLYRELMPLFQADMPLTMLLPGLQMTVAHRRVGGLSSPWRIYPTWYMDELWVENQ